MKEFLKIKVVSLSAEMTLIRRQELKWKKQAKYARQKQKQDSLAHAEDLFWGLRGHRETLKMYARHNHLAYGCMRGVPYSAMEQICYGPIKGMGGYEPNWQEVMVTVERFAKDEPSKTEIMQRAEQWLYDAKTWYEGNPRRIEIMEKTKRAEKQTEAWKAAGATRAAADATKYAHLRRA